MIFMKIYLIYGGLYLCFLCVGIFQCGFSFNKKDKDDNIGYIFDRYKNKNKSNNNFF